MRYILDLPTMIMSERYKHPKVKANLRISVDTNHPLHEELGSEMFKADLKEAHTG